MITYILLLSGCQTYDSDDESNLNYAPEQSSKLSSIKSSIKGSVSNLLESKTNELASVKDLTDFSAEDLFSKTNIQWEKYDSRRVKVTITNTYYINEGLENYNRDFTADYISGYQAEYGMEAELFIEATMQDFEAAVQSQMGSGSPDVSDSGLGWTTYTYSIDGESTSGDEYIYYEDTNEWVKTHDRDSDNDGIKNSDDNDIDGDGIPNGSDNDRDGDGVSNADDDYPNDSSKSITAESEAGKLPIVLDEIFESIDVTFVSNEVFSGLGKNDFSNSVLFMNQNVMVNYNSKELQGEVPMGYISNFKVNNIY